MKMYAKFLLTPLAMALALSTASYVSAETISVPLSGTAVVNEVTSMNATPALLDMGGVEIGQLVKKTLILNNIGSASDNSIVINGMTLNGAENTSFDVQVPGYTVLAPGDSVEVEVSFLPMSAGTLTATLAIDHDGADKEHIVFLRGQGEEPAVSTLEVSPESLSLGTTKLGVPATKTLTMSAIGDAGAPMVTLGELAISGENAEDFSVNASPGFTVYPGSIEQIKVQLLSETYGSKSATLSIKHDGANKTLKIPLIGKVEQEIVEQQPVFKQSTLAGANIERITTLQFGPDGKLYIGEMEGLIRVYTVVRNAPNNYVVTDIETIDLIQKVVNHDDDGQVNPNIKGRLLTGILVTGTANAPIIYANSSDPRQGGGPALNDTNLDTNSGILHRLTKQGGQWVKKDLLRGLPRSEENHQGNGLVFDQSGKKLLLSQGGNTNTGAPSNNFAFLPETALSGAILEIDLEAIGNTTYDLETLDDEDRPGVNDANDPFGGNNGKNQAILKADSPVQIYSPGYRNAYDIVLTESGRIYTFDNAGNSGWGGEPINCTNNASEQGSTYHDVLHYVNGRGYYGGHPNPTRGNKANKFNDSNPQSPVEVAANPVECTFKAQQVSIAKIMGSTNGLDEYTASNFGGAMKGDLITASFDKAIYRIELNEAGNKVMSKSKLFPSAGNSPLDVIAQGDGDKFPGTIWVGDFSGSKILVFEPEDY